VELKANDSDEACETMRSYNGTVSLCSQRAWKPYLDSAYQQD